MIRQFQPVERGRASQRRIPKLRQKPVPAQRIGLLASHGQQRIAAQPRMIIQILITQRHRVEPLGQQLLQGVINPSLLTSIAKTTRQRSTQTQPTIYLSQQQQSTVAGENAAGKIGHHFSRAYVLKKQCLVVTVCR